MGFMAEYLTHHVQDLQALCHGHPQLRHLSPALATACRALHRSVAWGRWGWSGATSRGHPPCPRPLWAAECGVKAREAPAAPLARSLLPCSEIDFTLAGLETLARVFDPPVSPRSPAREQVSVPTAPRDLDILWCSPEPQRGISSSATALLQNYSSSPSGLPGQRSRPGAAPQQDLHCQPPPVFAGEEGA